MNFAVEQLARDERYRDVRGKKSDKTSLPVVAIAAALALVTLAVYAPVRNFDFIYEYDDALYVPGNEAVKAGLTWRGIAWAFTTAHASNWHPITWLSHMLDVTLFGVRPGPAHLVNAVLHATNAVLLFLLVRKMTGATWRAAVVAALFAWHPLHVESVAWIAERKDVLSTLFWLLTTWAYVHYTTQPSRHRYVLVVVLFLLGLMSKPMLVTLPCVFLLLDYWPLGRFRERPWGTLFREKLPLIAISLLSSLLTYEAQAAGGSVATLERVPIAARMANAAVAYASYLHNTIWPVDLTFYYLRPASYPARSILAASTVIAVITVGVLVARRHRYLATGWFWYLGTLVPVIGLVQVGQQAMADRYTYVPLIGMFLAVVWIASDLAARLPSVVGRTLVSAATLAALGACLLLTSRQLGQWRDSETLFRSAIATNPRNYVALNNLGNVLNKRNQLDDARLLYQAALDIRPDYAGTHFNLATVLLRQGNSDAAIEHYRQAIHYEPFYPDAHYNLGVALAGRGDTAAAMQHYRKAIEQNDRAADAHHNLGGLLARSDQMDQAIIEFRRAITLRPGHAHARADLGLALARQGNIGEAADQFAAWARLEPRNPAPFYNLGNALMDLKDYSRAATAFTKALELSPSDPPAHHKLALCEMRRANFDQALQHYRAAVKLRPEWHPVANELAWILATHRDPRFRNGPEAIVLAENVVAKAGPEARYLGTLSAAYAEVGRFDDAIATAERAKAHASRDGQAALLDAANACLQAYRQQRPFRQ